MSVLRHRALNRATLARQLLLARADLSVMKAVERLLALQAQKPQPPYIALWTRLGSFQRQDLLNALHARTLVRATSMRGTLHIMRSQDFVAFRGALQPSLSDGRQSIVKKTPMPSAAELIATALGAFGAHGCTFSEVRAALVARFPNYHDRLMGYTVRMTLPLVQVPVAGEAWGFPSDAAFVPADAWLGEAIDEGRGAGAFILRYLAAYGPASTADIQNWTGFKGVAELIRPLRSKLVTFTDARGRELLDLPNAPRPGEDADAPVRFLPEYDSLILAHADRSRLIDEERRKALVTRNLIVPATFLVDGRVSGTWKVERKKATATLRLSPFNTLTKNVRRDLEREGDALLQFVEPDATTRVVR